MCYFISKILMENTPVVEDFAGIFCVTCSTVRDTNQYAPAGEVRHVDIPSECFVSYSIIFRTATSVV